MATSPNEPASQIKQNFSLNEIAADFKSQWISGSSRPEIEDYLRRYADSFSNQLTQKLVATEIELRASSGELLTSEEYLNRLPALGKRWLESLIDANIGETKALPLIPEKEKVVDSVSASNNNTGDLTDFTQTEFQAADRQSNALSNIGDYQIIDEIARGGMGVVFKARQTSLDRVVALKMILAGEMAADEDIQRFRSEAEAAANLDHPRIVPIYEIGELGGQPYFSMGFIEGESLQEKLIDGPLPAKEAALTIRKIAEAISYAHENGVIHRDLKPANVLCDPNGEPRVTDFGLAKRLGSNSDLTGTGQILGTPSFMPPEQALGATSIVDERSDIWALGAILYNLLTGRAPFHAASPIETLKQVVDKEPVSPRVFDPQIPVDLETITLKCMEKEQSKRYQSADELIAELDRFVNDEPILARPITRVEKCFKWCKRHKLLSVLAAAILLLFTSGIVLTIQLSHAEFKRALSEQQKLGSMMIGDSSLLHVRQMPQARVVSGYDYDKSFRAYIPPNKEFVVNTYFGPLSADPRSLPNDKNTGMLISAEIPAASTAREVVLFFAIRFVPQSTGEPSWGITRTLKETIDDVGNSQYAPFDTGGIIFIPSAYAEFFFDKLKSQTIQTGLNKETTYAFDNQLESLVLYRGRSFKFPLTTNNEIDYSKIKPGYLKEQTQGMSASGYMIWITRK